MFKNILLAADISDNALHAARTAGELARAMGCTSLCLTVTFPPVHEFLGEPNFDKVAAARMIEAEGIVDAMKREIGEIPGELQIEIIEGHATDVILNVSETLHCDLIVMGARSLGTIGHLLTGASSQRVASRASCPVMIVR